MTPERTRTQPVSTAAAQSDGQARLLQTVASVPRDHDGPVFRRPWEAQVFAMAVALHERGAFTWAEWSDALGRALAEAEPCEGPDDAYYQAWLAALEHLVADKNLSSSAALRRTRTAWARASARTPHGEPIMLRPEDFG